jgi:hypothetical protein
MPPTRRTIRHHLLWDSHKINFYKPRLMFLHFETRFQCASSFANHYYGCYCSSNIPLRAYLFGNQCSRNTFSKHLPTFLADVTDGYLSDAQWLKSLCATPNLYLWSRRIYRMKWRRTFLSPSNFVKQTRLQKPRNQENVFWDKTPHSLQKIANFREKSCCLHLQSYK